MTIPGLENPPTANKQLVEWVEGSRSNVIGLPMEIVLPWCEEWGEEV